ncbi:hypothetical protein LNK15_01350 [Jeotgalicoccus huakuii]|nr:hypothetical protein [Jeotgalicoccus huakuii]
MTNRKHTSIHIDENIYSEIKEYVRNSNDFNSISRLIEHLFKNFIENDPLVTDSNLEKIKKDLATTNRNTKILLQILTNFANKEQVIARDIYEDIYQYKSAVEIIDEYYNKRKMNKHNKDYNKNEESKNLFMNDIYRF